MQSYDLRRGQGKALKGDGLRGVLTEIFGKAEDREGKLWTTYGALTSLTTWTDGKSLFVDSHTDPTVAPGVAGETLRRWNEFLERATGYTTKERAKRAQAKGKA